jgi:hypothetical protein
LWLEDYKYKQMAYTINKTDGSVVATITDGTVDNTTSVQLFGKSFSGFGEGLNENLVKLLENSASTSAPTAPLTGELWMDTSTSQLKVYDGSSFKPTGGAKSSSTAPTSPGAGDLWHDSDDDQLYVYTGSAFQLVGPVYTAGQTLSGWKIETLGSSGGNKVVSSMYAGNTRVCILSKETFTPSVTLSGTSNTSSTVIAGGNFLRADAADTTTGALTIDANGGIIVGGAQELSITVASNNVTIAQTSQDKDIIFTVNDDGTTKTAFTIEGATGNVTVAGNLNVTGAYNYTSSEIVEHSDAFLKVNTGGSEADAGLIVETTDTDDARLFYDVSENFWSAGHGQSYSQIIRLADLTDDGNANKGTKGLTTDSSTGNLKVTTLTLNAVGSAITSTSSTDVPTIGQVKTFVDRFAGNVNTTDPSASDGADGDFWFVRES